MLAQWIDEEKGYRELYAEAENLSDNDEYATFYELKVAILEQAVEEGVNPEILDFFGE